MTRIQEIEKQLDQLNKEKEKLLAPTTDELLTILLQKVNKLESYIDEDIALGNSSINTNKCSCRDEDDNDDDDEDDDTGRVIRVTKDGYKVRERKRDLPDKLMNILTLGLFSNSIQGR